MSTSPICESPNRHISQMVYLPIGIASDIFISLRISVNELPVQHMAHILVHTKLKPIRNGDKKSGSDMRYYYVPQRSFIRNYLIRRKTTLISD